MNGIMGIVAGVIAGIVGGAIWAGVSYSTGYEIGWIAWIIGAIVGVAVAAGSRDTVGPGSGIVAAIIAILAVMGGKYASIRMIVEDFSAEMTMANDEVDDEFLISWLADDIVRARMDAGETIDWPTEWELDEASEEEEYPEDIWEEAEATWNRAGADWQEQHRTYVISQMKAEMDEFKNVVSDEAFMESFNWLDIIFFLLAIATAYQLGSGGGGGE